MAGFESKQANAVPPPVTVGPQREVCLPDFGCERITFEVAAAACQTSENEVVIMGGGQNAHAAVTLDGGLTFYALPSAGGDPFVVAEPNTGRIWLGGLSNANGIITNCRDQGAISLSLPSNVFVINAGLTDKPFMGIGPASGNLSVLKYYVMFNQKLPGCEARQIHVARADDPSSSSNWIIGRDSPATQVFSTCNTTGTCDYQGWGALPVVLDNGDIVAVSVDELANAGGCYNENRPVVTWSLNGGVTWNPTGGVPLLLGAQANPTIQAISMWTPSSAIGDTPWYVDRRKGAPSIAVDRRTSPNTVYVAFAARREATADLDGNSDIYIAKIQQQGQGGPYVTVGDPLHITDEMLGLTPHSYGPDQFVPAIAVDCSGGINLMFYDDRAETSAQTQSDDIVDRQVQVYYARITGWPGGTPQVFSQALTPTAFPVVHQEPYFGDYQTMAFGGPTPRRLYPVYIAKKFTNGQWVKTCFMHKVSVNLCSADLNFNMASDAGDVDTFADAFLTGDPAADLDEDGVITVDDLTVFEDAFDALANQ